MKRLNIVPEAPASIQTPPSMLSTMQRLKSPPVRSVSKPIKNGPRERAVNETISTFLI